MDANEYGALTEEMRQAYQNYNPRRDALAEARALLTLAAEKAMAAGAPVSYTHLDVYKRQDVTSYFLRHFNCTSKICGKLAGRKSGPPTGTGAPEPYKNRAARGSYQCFARRAGTSRGLVTGVWPGSGPIRRWSRARTWKP